MIRRYASCSTLVLLLVLSCAGSAGQNAELATVHLRIVDFAGHDIGPASVESFRSETSGRDFAGSFRGNMVSGVPFGIYHLRVSATGFWSAERNVRVFQADVWVVMQLELGMSSAEGGLRTFSLSGSIRNSGSPQQRLWVRVVGVYSGVVEDAMADRSTDFTMSGLPQGSYVLMVIGGNRVLETRPVEIPTAGQLELDVGARK